MIRERAREQAATVNDVAVAILLRTLACWNREHGVARDTHWLRILIPMDLRTGADSRLPAANRMGFSFLARRIGDCRDHARLLHGVHEEMNHFKQTRVGMDFIESISLFDRLPGVLPAILKWSGCMATAVLTTGHAPSRRFHRRFPMEDGQLIFGNLRLQRIFAVPPIRPGTRAGFGLCDYGGHLTIGLQADALYFDLLGAQQLLDLYIDEWRRWIARDGNRRIESRDATAA